jgi:hypothetical protein
MPISTMQDAIATVTGSFTRRDPASAKVWA